MHVAKENIYIFSVASLQYGKSEIMESSKRWDCACAIAFIEGFKTKLLEST